MTVYEQVILTREAEMKRLNIRSDAFLLEWSYAVIPRRPHVQQLLLNIQTE
jgi:hypothetical protein